MNDFEQVVTQTRISIGQIESDSDIIKLLSDNGWDTQPTVVGQDMFYYNRSRNAAIKINQSMSFLSIGVISIAHPQHDSLYGPMQISNIISARQFLFNAIVKFAGYDPFNATNDFNALTNSL